MPSVKVHIRADHACVMPLRTKYSELCSRSPDPELVIIPDRHSDVEDALPGWNLEASLMYGLREPHGMACCSERNVYSQ